MQNATSRVVKSVSAVDAGVPAGVHVGKLPAVRAQAEAETPLATRVAPNWIAQLPPEPGVVGSNPAALTKTGSSCGHSLAPGSRSAIWSYARRNIWIDVADLEQEAGVAAIVASRRWQPGKGRTREQFESDCVARALSRLVAEMRVPVSLPKCKGPRWKEASTATRARVAVCGDEGELVESSALVGASIAVFEPLENAIDTKRAVCELLRRMDHESETARAVLLGEEKPANVAERMGLAVAKVYADTSRAMRNLRAAMRPQFAKG